MKNEQENQYLINIDLLDALREKLRKVKNRSVIIGNGIVVAWDEEDDRIIAYNVLSETKLMEVQFVSVGGIEFDIEEIVLRPEFRGFRDVNRGIFKILESGKNE